jgi:hypothetical protein
MINEKGSTLKGKTNQIGFHLSNAMWPKFKLNMGA